MNGKIETLKDDIWAALDIRDEDWTAAQELLRLQPVLDAKLVTQRAAGIGE